MNAIYRSEAGARLLREKYAATLEHWPIPHERQHVPTPEGATFVISAGPEVAPPLLLLHGSGSNSTQWMGRIAELAAHFRVYAVDVIGEPGFSAPARPPWKSSRYTEWLDAVLHSLGIAQTSIMAISLGGWLALDYATRHPDRVTRLALSCPIGIGRQRPGFLFSALVSNSLGERGRRRNVARTLGPVLATMDPEHADAVIEQILLISANYRFRSDSLPVFDDSSLRSLTMPMHVLVGSADVMVDSAQTQRRLARNVPHATVRVLPNTGHLIGDQGRIELDFLLHSEPREAS
ncbi:alpha/beta fold hydrolase [Actinoalloteichus hymeniacidonis]|uniref:Hydrolase or acyltransferase of alpha/beta superfamily n=1 Tax=Actinoalloteichus hymeniacidonis TaxID=340345 RepID=A0AAC9HN75_9PSEU|nr:alpha/beta fold hydrolase [Actinoalloteichus hymeniacidonis]AOS62365.1 putative hydrolase or acyltransferase of alpha/beta superfamily [Actinoalloteichus hymeniacidonis]MBB5909607.1 pimeloyl-ACP methyl ester carboxylesterase [Actinoalloteichus hymeniacidonis]